MNRTIVLLAAAIAASGCIRLLPEPAPPPRLYVLRAEAGSVESAALAARAAPAPIVVAVASPVAPRALAGSDIAWRTDGQFAYVGGASWAGRSTDLLQNMLVDTIDNSSLARGAVRAGEAKADVEIQWDVLEFEIVEAADLKARATFRAKLFDARTRTLQKTITVSEERPVSNRSTSVATRALEDAARAGATRIAAWAIEPQVLLAPPG